MEARKEHLPEEGAISPTGSDDRHHRSQKKNHKKDKKEKKDKHHRSRDEKSMKRSRSRDRDIAASNDYHRDKTHSKPR